MNQILLQNSTSLFHRVIIQSHPSSLIRSSNSSRIITAPLLQNIIHNHTFSTETSKSSSAGAGCYAIVDHSKAYTESMAGRHGKQLSLAYTIESKRVSERVQRKKYYKNLLIEEERQFQEKRNGAIESGDDDVKLLEESKKDVDASVDVEEEDDGDEEMYDEEEEEDEEEGMVVSTHKYLTASQKAAYKAGAPSSAKFAIIRLAKSNQFKITIDDVIIVDKLTPTSYYSVGSILNIPCEDILLVGDCNRTNVGLPYVKGAVVTVRIEEITHDKTIVVFKKRRRKNSKRKNGFRREVTFVRILDIKFPNEEEVVVNNDDNVVEKAA